MINCSLWIHDASDTVLQKEELFQYEKRNALCSLMDASIEC